MHVASTHVAYVYGVRYHARLIHYSDLLQVRSYVHRKPISLSLYVGGYCLYCCRTVLTVLAIAPIILDDDDGMMGLAYGSLQAT